MSQYLYFDRDSSRRNAILLIILIEYLVVLVYNRTKVKIMFHVTLNHCCQLSSGLIEMIFLINTCISTFLYSYRFDR